MQIHNTFLFTSNLDNALLPNGTQTAAAGCLERTWELLKQLKAADYSMVYVTDHYLSLAIESQKTFKLPDPDYWICNLGTEIHDAMGNPDKDWENKMGPTFNRKALLSVLKGNPNLRAQEEEKQGPHKLSFNYLELIDDTLRTWMSTRIGEVADGIRLIDTVADSSESASIDLVPTTAGKAQALSYLMEKLGLPKTRVFFSGDSENDLDVLMSGVCGTLLGNAARAVQDKVRERAENTESARLILSRGYYGDGIIEGLRAYDFIR
uniref:Sucrose phosphatase-like domain-containing protein n=1 Tax=Candidatus Kentrum sp. TUN TaxID=2126343 RepID=A0A450ZQG1_9GAMM|nr:MAG: hypothetical protein BECKTUN1418D_GA0071000_103915 [Candidatus Kentron sp. TUN]